MTTTIPGRVESVGATWQHLPALDGLRAFAVIAVLLFHGGYLTGGFLGVDLFFALSGFLITSLLIRDASGAGVHLTQFWGRRFRRLLPAVFTMIAIVALWAWWFGQPADLDGVTRDGPWAVLYLANWHLINESSGYWASFSQPAMFDHLWSLAIEEQFYVLWPLVVLIVWRRSRRPQRTLAAVCVLGSVASFVTMLTLYSGGDPTRVYMGTDTRASSLLVGALMATDPARRGARRLVAAIGARLDLVVGALVVGVGSSWVLIDGASSEALYRGGLLTHSAACTVLVLLVASASAAAEYRYHVVHWLGWAPLAWIGTLSYGLYLWHWPIYVVVSADRVPLDGIALLTVRIALSFVAAAISLRVVENPLRYRVTWARGRRGVIALITAVSVLLAGLWLLPDPPTEIAAFDPTAVTAVASEDTVSDTTPATTQPMNASTTTTPATRPVPTTSTPRRETISNVLWGGDSVAFDLAPAIEASLTAAGVGVDPTAAFPGVHVTAERSRPTSLLTQAADKLTAQQADTMIMVISGWDADADSATYRDGLVALADELHTYGAQRLIVVTAPPVADDTRNGHLERLAGVAAEVAGERDDVWFIDASPVWVTPVVLDANGDGAPERRRDLVHVCPQGAAGFAAWFTDQLARRFDGISPVEPVEWASGPWTTDLRFDEPVGSCAPL